MCVLRRLSLIEDDIAERDEDEIEDYQSDSDTGYTLVRTKKNKHHIYSTFSHDCVICLISTWSAKVQMN